MLSPKIDVKGSCLFLLLFIVFFFWAALYWCHLATNMTLHHCSQKKIKKENND
jgi:hypothetical protein